MNKPLTDNQIIKLAKERYKIENPKCINERFFKQRMRNDYIRKLKEERAKLLKDENI